MRVAHWRIAGLIPARAGSTRRLHRFPEDARAHPRPCGEHPSPSRPHGSGVGSSPPVRGALRNLLCHISSRGLIPARAGSTIGNPAPFGFEAAHPRPCGEHFEWDVARLGDEGSSPPVRGAPPMIFREIYRRGLIPARAGSTI